MKHIISVIDGTWLNAANRPSFDKYSNAYAINWLLDDDPLSGDEQVVFYSSGLGATGLMQDYTAGAFAEGIDHQIRDAYINICSNFREKKGVRDKIYVFGFSRGAVAARALAGLISDFGLLRPNQIKYYSRLWKAYTSSEPVAVQLENAMIRDIDIEFMGLFDAVFGASNERSAFKSLQFNDFRLSKKVKVCVHILALDDRRAAFRPMLIDGCEPSQHLEQIWMPGVHSDIGGTAARDFLGRCALETMIDRVSEFTGLSFNTRALTQAVDRQNKDIDVSNERAGLWRLSIPRSRKPRFQAQEQYLHPLAYKIGDRLNTRYGKPHHPYVVPAPFRQQPFPTFIGFRNRTINWVPV